MRCSGVADGVLQNLQDAGWFVGRAPPRPGARAGLPCVPPALASSPGCNCFVGWTLPLCLDALCCPRHCACERVRLPCAPQHSIAHQCITETIAPRAAEDGSKGSPEPAAEPADPIKPPCDPVFTPASVKPPGTPALGEDVKLPLGRPSTAVTPPSLATPVLASGRATPQLVATADGTEDAGVAVEELKKALRAAVMELKLEEAKTPKVVQRALDKYRITVPEV